MLTYTIVFLLFVNILGNIWLIGRDRQPKTHGEAIADMLFMAIIIYLLLI